MSGRLDGWVGGWVMANTLLTTPHRTAHLLEDTIILAPYDECILYLQRTPTAVSGKLKIAKLQNCEGWLGGHRPTALSRKCLTELSYFSTVQNSSSCFCPSAGQEVSISKKCTLLNQSNEVGSLLLCGVGGAAQSQCCGMYSTLIP